VLQQHSQAAHAQPFSKKVDPKFFVQTFLGGGVPPTSGYGPVIAITVTLIIIIIVIINIDH